MKKDSILDVIVVGAGISGLYAAYLLKNEGYHVKVLEASNTYGGRIKSLTGFSKSPIELGAEFIHGKYSVLYDLLEYFEEELIEIKGKNYLWYQNELLSENKAAQNPKIEKAFDFMDNSWRYRGMDMTAEEYLIKRPFDDSVRQILEVFALEYGTSNEKIGMRSLAMNESQWVAGDQHFKLKSPMLNILREFIESLGQDIVYNTAVNKIKHENEEITVLSENQTTFTCKKIVCTIPLSMLKKGIIQFSPDLPADKKAAIATLGMDSGVKVFLKFNDKFWKNNMWELFGTKSSPLYYNLFPGTQSDENVLVAYMMGKYAEQFIAKGNQAISELVLELDHIFGDKQASNNLENSLIMNWKNEKYIEGAYSFDTPFSEGKREILAQTINNRIFFAGEASNFTGHSSTLHGAMETAERCFQEIKSILKLDKSA